MIKNGLIALAWVAVLLVALGLSTVPKANAQAACDLKKSDFDKLDAIKTDQRLDYALETKSELQTRKELLGKVIDCAILEAGNESDALVGISTKDSDLYRLAKNLSGRLDDVIRYYDSQKVFINDLGLAGSRYFSQSLAQWRSGNYKPLAESVNYLLVWTQNQNIIATVESRINQVRSTLSFFGATDNDDIKHLLNNAQSNVSSAIQDNQKARGAILASDDSAPSLIKSSLEHLAEVYQNFFEISSIINRGGAQQ